MSRPAAINVVLYAVLEAMCALVASILLMSHLYDRRRANTHPMSQHAVLAIGVGNFAIWLAIAAVSFSAILGGYVRVEFPIAEEHVSLIKGIDTMPKTAEVCAYDVTYRDVSVKPMPADGEQGRAYVTAWFDRDMSQSDMEAAVDAWGRNGDLEHNLIVTL